MFISFELSSISYELLSFRFVSDISIPGKFLLDISIRSNPKCQVCFPGGMRDETDRSVVDTALRECEEEIQLQRDVVKVTSVLPSLK